MPAKRHIDMAIKLADWVANHPDGFIMRGATLKAIGARTPSEAGAAVRILRGHLATVGAGWNLVCEPAGKGNPWVYRLANTLAGGADPWIRNRLGDQVTRTRSSLHVLASIIDATDGRSADGRTARILHRHYERALQDLAEVEERLPTK